MKMTKKFVSIVLVAMMVATMVPAMAISASATETPTPITDAAGLASACENGGSFILQNDITISSDVTVKAPVTIDGDSNKIIFDNGGTIYNYKTYNSNYTEASLTITDATLKTSVSSDGIRLTDAVGITLTNCDVDSVKVYGSGTTPVYMTNCRVYYNLPLSVGGDVYVSTGNGEFNSCIFYYKTYISIEAGSSVTFNNCKFFRPSASTVEGNNIYLANNGTTTVNINGGTCVGIGGWGTNGTLNITDAEIGYIDLENSNVATIEDSIVHNLYGNYNASNITNINSTIGHDAHFTNLSDYSYPSANDFIFTSNNNAIFTNAALSKDVEDNIFTGLEDVDYRNATFLGYQIKDDLTQEEVNSSESVGLRFVTAVKRELLTDSNIEDYGYVAVLTNREDYWGYDARIKPGNDQYTFSCKNTANTISGNYGNPADTSTSYKYVTLAVDNVPVSQIFAIRFYIKTTDGQYHYAVYDNESDGETLAHTACFSTIVDSEGE